MSKRRSEESGRDEGVGMYVAAVPSGPSIQHQVSVAEHFISLLK